MRKMMIVCLTLAVLPATARAQTEVGIDAGITANLATTNATNFNIPTAAVRVAMPFGEGMLIEGIGTFNLLATGGNTFTNLTLIPGVVYFLSDEAGRQTYVRGEAGFRRAGGATQWTVGAAGGLRKEMQPGVLWRLEGGIARWLANNGAGLAAFTQLRAWTGFSVVLN